MYCGETAETVAARPGWGSLDAVANGGVIEMNDDIASRWGPRIVEYLQIAGAAVAHVSQPWRQADAMNVEQHGDRTVSGRWLPGCDRSRSCWPCCSVP